MVSDLWWGQSYCQSCTGGTFDDGKYFMLNMTVVSFVAFRILEKYYAGLSDSTFILWDNASPILLIGAWQDSIMALVGSTFPDVALAFCVFQSTDSTARWNMSVAEWNPTCNLSGQNKQLDVFKLGIANIFHSTKNASMLVQFCIFCPNM